MRSLLFLLATAPTRPTTLHRHSFLPPSRCRRLYTASTTVAASSSSSSLLLLSRTSTSPLGSDSDETDKNMPPTLRKRKKAATTSVSEGKTVKRKISTTRDATKRSSKTNNDTTTLQTKATTATTIPKNDSLTELVVSEETMRTVEAMLDDKRIYQTITKSGWCIREGMGHLMEADGGSLAQVIRTHGPPKVYKSINEAANKDKSSDTSADNDDVDNTTNTGCFHSLCRIIVGQQLAGAAAKTMFRRLLETTNHNLTPSTILELANRDFEEHLRGPARLSNSKAKAIVDLARHFDENKLDDTFLTTGPCEEVRERLLSVKGLGPWSCDMFQLFHTERADLLPVGDLGVRKGMQKQFGLQGTGKGKALDPKKDLDLLLKVAEPFRPYRALFSIYMWQVADTKDFTQDGNDDNDDTAKASSKAKTKTSKKKTTKKTKK